MKLGQILLWGLSFMLLNNIKGQNDNYRYRTDIEDLLEKTYNFEHTFLQLKDTGVPYLYCDTTTQSTSSEWDRFQAVSFLDHITEVIPNETNVLIISENHLVYQSRNLLLNFIQQLKDKGFTNVYIEALGYDEDLNKRGYPITTSGHLLNEPTMAHLIRELMIEGFNLYPYEERKTQEETSKNAVLHHFEEEQKLKKSQNKPINSDQYSLESKSPFLGMSIRDFSQYKNIMQTFNPNEKSIILCGHGHGMKKPYGGWRPLGYWLSLNPEVNLFSIENSESINQEKSELNDITCHFNQDSPFFLIDTSQNVFYSETRYQPYERKQVGGLFDMNIFYPINYHALEKTPVSSSGKELTLNTSHYNFPLLIIKYMRNEYVADKELAIPTDIELIRKATDVKRINVAKNEIVIVWDGKRKTKIEK